jgi:hypothetical protein
VADDRDWIGLAIKYGLPIVVVGGGIAILWSWVAGQNKVNNAIDQYHLYYDAYITKFNNFNADGTIDSAEEAELEREQKLMDQAVKDLSDAVRSSGDPFGIQTAVGILSVTASAILIGKYGVKPAIDSLKNYQKNSGQQKLTQYQLYEMAHMADALSVADINPILATQRLTVANTLFNNYTIPSLQAQVDFLQAHMNQFIGMELLYAQYMTANLMLDASFISTQFYPYAFTLIPV